METSGIAANSGIVLSSDASSTTSRSITFGLGLPPRSSTGEAGLAPCIPDNRVDAVAPFSRCRGFLVRDLAEVCRLMGKDDSENWKTS
jgi:hypothetical protein